MKKFRFTLQAVHELREARRAEAERALVRADDAARAAAHGVEEIRQTHERAADDYAARLRTGDIDPFGSALSVNYLAALTRREREAHAHLSELEREREIQRAQTAAAARDAQATARLHERQRDRHQREVARVEQEMLDEMATLAKSRLHSRDQAS